MYKNPWIFEGRSFGSEDIKEFFGFVYCITNTLTNRQYIGRKYFWKSRKQPGKKKRTRSESDWKQYYGSCNELKEDLSLLGEENFSREIVSLHTTKGDTNYFETKLQFKLDVLESLTEDGQRAFYNNNIMSRYFAPKNLHYVKTPKHKRKISETLKQKGIRPPTCNLPLTEEQKRKISETLKQNSHFVTQNPQKENTYEIEDENGKRFIVDNFHSWCENQNISFNALRMWSKSQTRRQFNGKVKQTKYHKKYKIRILGWSNPRTGKKEKYFPECSL